MAGSYVVLTERAAERDLRRLDPALFSRVVVHLKRLANNPRPSGCRKIVGSDDSWRIRVGDYRVVYEVDDGAHEVRIMRVRHRREVYLR
jgi:mRNA interferase RelE/StbE